MACSRNASTSSAVLNMTSFRTKTALLWRFKMVSNNKHVSSPEITDFFPWILTKSGPY